MYCESYNTSFRSADIVTYYYRVVLVFFMIAALLQHAIQQPSHVLRYDLKVYQLTVIFEKVIFFEIFKGPLAFYIRVEVTSLHGP